MDERLLVHNQGLHNAINPLNIEDHVDMRPRGVVSDMYKSHVPVKTNIRI